MKSPLLSATVKRTGTTLFHIIWTIAPATPESMAS